MTYNTHSTFRTNKTYLTQSQPKLVKKDILPTKKKTPISTIFPPEQFKTQSSSMSLSKHLINSPPQIRVISPLKINVH